MPFSFDFEKMEKLLRSFYKISNMRYSLVDINGMLLCFSSEYTEYCQRMNEDAEGHARCMQCDADAIAHARGITEDAYVYRCHAGLLEAVIPIRQHGEAIAFTMFGELAEQGNMEAQWRQARALIDWMPDADSFRDSFMKVPQIDAERLEGCADILSACSSYVCMEGLVRSASMSDEQQLTQYIADHYTEQLSLDEIARTLLMSKTKLCSVASRQGTTVMELVKNRRMEEAKRLLRNSGGRGCISEIARQVGIRDYNYFTKLFRAYTGETPREYRARYGNAR